MDRTFHLTFEHQINGFFPCIPNWQFGFEPAELDAENRGMNSMLSRTALIAYEDVTTRARALSLLRKQRSI